MTPTGPTGGSMDGQVVLGGKYVLGDILGTGGTYTVYEAARVPAAADGPGGDADDQPPPEAEAGPALVVKVLHPHLIDDAAARAAMAREIAASELVDHPGVAKILDTGEDEVAGANVPWLLTGRLPGVPLSELTGGEGLPWRESLLLVDGLLDALAAVHAAGLVHRDVSPRNVVVDRHDGEPVVGLLDLGLTAPGGGDGDGELVAGSVVGMSPEQAQGRPLDERSDLYAVGALTYYALTGHAPYERARADDVLRAHVGAPVPAPSARRAAVPVAVDRFVARAMAKDPALRFTSAEEMRASVATLLGTGGVTNGTGPTGEPTMTLDQIAAEDPHRTAVVGAAGGIAAAAAAAAAGDEAELQRTRQLGAAGSASTPTQDGPAAAAAADPAPEPVEPVDEAAQEPPSRRRKALIAVLAIVLAAAVAAAAFWMLREPDDGGPVAPPTHSPSPSPSPTPSESQPTTAPPPPADPAPRSTPTADPEPTVSETPTDDPSPTPSPDETTDEPTSTPTADPEPTDDPEPTSTPDPEPTDEDPTEPAGQTPPADPPPDDGADDGGDTTEGDAEPMP